MSDNTKRHIKSAGLTFLAGFVLAIAPEIGDLTWTWTGQAALFALIISGVRGGLKPLWEMVLFWAQNRQS